MTALDKRPSLVSRNAAMRADWMAGMRQVEIAAKHGVSQGTVSKVCGGSPRFLREEVARLRAAVTEYLSTASTLSQQERDRVLVTALLTATKAGEHRGA